MHFGLPYRTRASHVHDWKLAIHPFTAAIRQLEAKAKPKESINCDCLTILCLRWFLVKGIMEAYQAAGPSVGKIVHIKAGSGLSLEMGWI